MNRAANRVRVFFAALAGVALVSAFNPGCGPAPVSATAPVRASEVTVALSTPEEAARSMLSLVQAELRARRAGDAAEADRIRARMIEVASAKGIEDRFTAHPRFRGLVGDDPVRSLADIWGATIAYYAEGIDFATLRVDPRLAPGEAKRADVLVQARGKDDAANIRVQCHRDPDGLWRIVQVSFDPPGGAASPSGNASRPAATRPAGSAPASSPP